MDPPDIEARRALAFVVGHINVSSRDMASAIDILEALRGEITSPSLKSWIRALLNETDVETLSDLVRSGAVGYDRLACHAATLLPADHDTRLWLEEHV